jgi:hypothetical protein
MSTYVCPEFAATGIELQIIELQVQRENALEHGLTDEVAACDRAIADLWAELAELVELYPETLPALSH